MPPEPGSNAALWAEAKVIGLYVLGFIAWVIGFIFLRPILISHLGNTQWAFVIAILWPAIVSWIVFWIALPFATARIRRARRRRNVYIAQEMRPD